MRLSVIVPFFNVEKYIQKCAVSLLEQTYREMEIIFVNDGSEDSSSVILQKTIDDYPEKQTKTIYKKNEGLPQARKTGVENATGEYIAFVDSDDWLDCDFYKRCMSIIEKHREINVFNTGFFYEYPNNKKQLKSSVEKYKCISSGEFVSMIHQRKMLQSVCTKIFKREVFDYVKFPTGNFVGEDYITLMQILKKEVYIGLLPANGYHYRILNNSMSNGAYGVSKKKGFVAFYKSYPYIKRLFPQNNKALDSFYCVEFMAVLVAMGRSRIFDEKKITFIRCFLFKRFFSVVGSKYVDFRYKISILPLIVFPRLSSVLFSKISDLL